MTYEETMTHFVDGCAMCTRLDCDECETGLAIEALEMQIPLKPTMFDNCGNVTATDRCCKCYEIIWNNYSHCPYCGQAIDWSK